MSDCPEQGPSRPPSQQSQAQIPPEPQCQQLKLNGEYQYIDYRYYCEAYQRGIQDGYNEGFQAGNRGGFRDGYNAGFEVGITWRPHNDQEEIQAEYYEASPVCVAPSTGQNPMLTPHDVLAHRKDVRIRRYREEFEWARGFEDDDLWLLPSPPHPNNLSEPPTPDAHPSPEENSGQSAISEETEVPEPSDEDSHTCPEDMEVESDVECRTPTSTE